MGGKKQLMTDIALVLIVVLMLGLLIAIWRSERGQQQEIVPTPLPSLLPSLTFPTPIPTPKITLRDWESDQFRCVVVGADHAIIDVECYPK